MTYALSYLLSAALLFLVGAVVSRLIQKFLCHYASDSFTLKINYVLLISAFLLPLGVVLYPASYPFSPVIKVWEQTEIETIVPDVSESNATVEIEWPQILSAGKSVTSNGSDLQKVALGLWTLYFLVAGLILVVSHLRLKKLLQSALCLRSYKSIRVWLSDKVTVPFSYFNGSYHVVLPENFIEKRDLFRISLQHELQHHRQKDTLWVYFFECLKILFGWNPALRLWLKDISHLQEVVCDAKILKKKTVTERGYCSSLLAVATYGRLNSAIPLGAVGMASSQHHLTRRVSRMLQRKKNLSRTRIFGVSTLSVLILTSASWASGGLIGRTSLSLEEAKVFADKTSSAQSIPILINPSVLYWLNQTLKDKKSRDQMKGALRLMKTYQPMIEAKLKEKDLPLELMAVPLVESGYRNNRVSSQSAAGIWQFIPGTARKCGLVVNQKLDERFQADRLTDAAVCFYSKLHAAFQDWHVTLAAYNIGESAMLRAIMANGHNDAFVLSQSGALGREGGSYLPKIMAGMILLKNQELLQ
ncbi:MAG: transglycosylase SLT domain-containing protein [Bdellovibrionales bacterium]|nr:transglycosylase SLT domain-containing protein [Bdellovibrionales bacterium]